MSEIHNTTRASYVTSIMIIGRYNKVYIDDDKSSNKKQQSSETIKKTGPLRVPTNGASPTVAKQKPIAINSIDAINLQTTK